MKINKIIFIVLLFNAIGTWSQSNNKLCICFDTSNDFLNVKTNKDSTHTSFSIVKEGFESKSERDLAMEKHKENMFEPYPVFYYSFSSTQKPKVISSVDNLCPNFVELSTFRKNNYQKPKGTHSSLFIFLQKLNDSNYLKWEVLLMAEE